MSQQINLFNPVFRKQRIALTFASMFALVLLALLTLLAIGAYRQQHVKGLQQEAASAEALLAAQRKYADRLKGDSVAAKGDAGAAAEIARLESELKTARASMEALAGGALGDRHGFAEYLRAFSRQSLNGLWLTGFSIGGGQVALQGRTMQPDLVPNYIQRLNQESVLKGRVFSTLEMRQPKPAPEAPAKDGNESKAASSAEKMPAFLEFSMGTADSAVSPAAVPSPVAASQSHAPAVTFTPAKAGKQP